MTKRLWKDGKLKELARSMFSDEDSFQAALDHWAGEGWEEREPTPVGLNGSVRTIFDKTYEGFEDIYDLPRDVHEAFDPRFNPKAKGIPGEFQGRMRVTITYEPDADDPAS